MRQYDMENEQSQQDVMLQHYEWHQAFYTLVSQPKVATFQKLLQDPQAKAQRAYLWMLFPGIVSGIVSQALAAQFLASSWFTIIVLGSILGGILGVMRFIASGWLIQRVAVLLGGDKNGYGKFHYARGIYMPVMIIIYMLITLFLGNNSTILSIVFAAALAIELMLTGLALRAVNKNLPWNQIILTISIWYFIIIVFASVFGTIF